MRSGLLVVAVGVVVAGPTAHAQPAARSAGNLRVTVTCADYFVAPRDGLQLRIDGVVQPALGIDRAMLFSSTPQGDVMAGGDVETDVGYHLAPGHHHIELSTPDCAGSTDLDMPPVSPRDVTGQLAITNDALRGTVTAPNGFGFMLGGFYSWGPAHAGTNFDDTTRTAGQLTMTISYQHWVFALDQRYGAETTNGMGHAFDAGFVARYGPRWAFHDVELAAGVGVGGDVEPQGRFFLPVWAMLTYKPTCSWGVQATASYDVDPSSIGESSPALAAGILWQPSRACAQTPRLYVNDPFRRESSIDAAAGF